MTALKDTPDWVKMCIYVLLAAMAIWGTAWGASKSKSADSHLVSSHETRIAKAEVDIDKLAHRANESEKRDIALAKDQQAILNNQVDFKLQLNKQSDLQIEQIKQNAELFQYLKSIESIDQ